MSNLYTGESRDGWDGQLYRETCSFVPAFGESLLNWLQPEDGERILDVGCGTGELTAKISERGARAIGLDPSVEMLREAKQEFHDPSFIQADIRSFESSNPFDAVFSNAALHWIPEPEKVIQSIKQNLKPGGRFVAEMGAQGNISTVRRALHRELETAGYDPDRLDPWYFPTPAEYIGLLREWGFNVKQHSSFERPAELFGEEGLKLWLIMFAGDFFSPLDENERDRVISNLVERLHDALYQNGKWILGYTRLRFLAVENHQKSSDLLSD